MAPSRAIAHQATIAAASFTSFPSVLRANAPAARQLHAISFSRPAIARPLSRSVLSLPTRRWDSSASSSNGVEPPDYLGEGELNIFNILKEQLQPTKLEVQDVSGGCGSMYALDIVSEKFKGLSVIKQHRLVNSVLKDEIKKWHGVQLKTKAP